MMYEFVKTFRLHLLFFLVGTMMSIQNTQAYEQTEENVNINVNAPIRALHIVLSAARQNKSPITLQEAKNLVSKAKENGFNTIVVLITNNIPASGFSGLVRKNAWDRDTWNEFVRFVQDNGMVLVPEIKLLTKQKHFFKNRYPLLMYNKATYNPKNPDVYSVVYKYLDAVIDIIKPKAIHIGHDEVAGHNRHSQKKYLDPGENMLPADLFLHDVKLIASYLKDKGIETWMWGDMLISPREAPDMRKGNLHGRKQGYGKALRAKIPKEIVILDWHYRDEQPEYPSIKLFQDAGFRVLGATWKFDETTKNFSRYAAQNNAEGMVATTWFYVPRKEWNAVARIIKISGEAFSQDFPDEK